MYKIKKNIFYTLYILIVSFLILEVLTRVAFSFKFNDSSFYFYPKNFVGNDGFYYRINNQDNWLLNNDKKQLTELQGNNYFKATLNKFNYRFNINKINLLDKKNIIVMGGSTTFGHNNDGKIYPDILQKELGNKFNVLNLGKRAAVVSQFIDIYEETIPKNINIDFAILYIGQNDSPTHHVIFSAHEKILNQFKYYNNLIFGNYFLFSRQIAITLISFDSRNITKKILEKKQIYNKEYFDQNYFNFNLNLTKLIKHLKYNNPKIKIILIPELAYYYLPSTNFNNFDFENNKEYEAYKLINLDLFLKKKALSKIQNGKNIFYLDNFFFNNYKVQDLLIDSVHLSNKGNEILSMEITKLIKTIL